MSVGKRIDAAIQQFKSFFPSSSVPKGKELLLVKTAQNSLAVEFEVRYVPRHNGCSSG